MTEKERMVTNSGRDFQVRLGKDFRRNYMLYLLMFPVLLFYLYFCYKPMYGLLISFQDFNFKRGISGSDWVGFLNFTRFFSDPYFLRNITNTVTISLCSILFGFPMPIILALLINEIYNKKFVTIIQTVTYLPNFISLVVICGIVRNFVSADGIMSTLVQTFGGKGFQESLLNHAKYFVPIYLVSDIWQTLGWNTVIYMAALAGVDMELYDAAEVDGAGRLRQAFCITIPSILPTIIILFIIRMGSALSVGYEKIILLTNPYNAETSEVLSYYIFKKGIIGGEYGLATAAGLFNSVINCVFVVATNYLSNKTSEISLW